MALVLLVRLNDEKSLQKVGLEFSLSFSEKPICLDDVVKSKFFVSASSPVGPNGHNEGKILPFFSQRRTTRLFAL